MARQKTVAGFALLGALSGAITTGIFIVVPENWWIEIGSFDTLLPLSILPGLVFGILFGGLLGILGLASTGTAVLFAVASTVSCFLAFIVAISVFANLEWIWQAGVIAGLVGAASLTAAAELLLPCMRPVKTSALMVAVGGLLGALLVVPVREGSGFIEWLVLFVLWQSGYAAAFATALPPAVKR